MSLSSAPPSVTPPGPPQPSAGPPARTATALAAIAVLAVVALFIALLAGAFRGPTQVSETISVPGQPASLDAATIYAAANPGVVDITAHSTTTEPAGPLGAPQKAETTDTGTGFVLDREGHIVTADHVVANASAVSVRLADGHVRTAEVLAGDPATDVAVLRVDPKGLTLHPLTLGETAGLRVGDPLAVIGDPFDVQHSLSVGIVSGLDRTIKAPNGFSILHAIQTDAAINPGNSGGPILDARGRVIGIADQIATGNSGGDSSTGVGFAVPIDLIRSQLPELKAGRVPAHADLGVAAADSAVGKTRGALVGVLPRGSAAAAAGVRRGDLIVALGGKPINGVNALVAALSSARAGAPTTVTVLRAGQRHSFKVTLGRQPVSVPDDA